METYTNLETPVELLEEILEESSMMAKGDLLNALEELVERFKGRGVKWGK